jgi:MHS family proline/betaine transporter-like MFS transporter
VLTACGYFLISVFFANYFENILRLDRKDALIIQSVNMVLFSLSILFGGWLADIIGKRRQMLIATLVLSIVSYPLFLLMGRGTPAAVFFGELGMIVIFSVYYGPIPAAICSMFPTSVRLAGVSLAHNFAMAAFGAYAPTLAIYLVQWSGNIAIPAVLFILSSLVTSAALWRWQEKREY